MLDVAWWLVRSVEKNTSGREKMQIAPVLQNVSLSKCTWMVPNQTMKTQSKTKATQKLRLPSFGHNLVQSESVKRCPVHREKAIQNVADISTGFWSILNGVQGSTFTRVYSWPLTLSCVHNLLLRYPTLLTENHKFTSIRPETTRIHFGKQTKSKTKKFGMKKQTHQNNQFNHWNRKQLLRFAKY